MCCWQRSKLGVQVAESGSEKALRAQAQNVHQHAALVQEMYQIADSADAETLLSGYGLNEYLEQLRDSHAQVHHPAYLVITTWYPRVC